jgi:hypothetical protein
MAEESTKVKAREFKEF